MLLIVQHAPPDICQYLDQLNLDMPACMKTVLFVYSSQMNKIHSALVLPLMVIYHPTVLLYCFITLDSSCMALSKGSRE